MRLEWIETMGGPHLVMPEKYAAQWDGIFTPRNGRVVEATFRCNPAGPATDYDRACSVDKWVGVIEVGKGQALLLHTGDSAVAHHRHMRGRHFLLEWIAAESETALLDRFHDVWNNPPIQVVTFYHPGGKLFLMDSADVAGYWQVNHGEFIMPSGKYKVLTAYVTNAETSIAVHQFQRVSGLSKRALESDQKQ